MILLWHDFRWGLSRDEVGAFKRRSGGFQETKWGLSRDEVGAFKRRSGGFQETIFTYPHALARMDTGFFKKKVALTY